MTYDITLRTLLLAILACIFNVHGLSVPGERQSGAQGVTEEAVRVEGCSKHVKSNNARAHTHTH